jgi:hypothetical protein
MMPFVLGQLTKKRIHLVKGPMLGSPLNVLSEAEDLRVRRSVPPSGKDERECWFPTLPLLAFLGKHLVEFLPPLRLGTDAVVPFGLRESFLQTCHGPSSPATGSIWSHPVRIFGG